jgi:diaminopimelate epimerase
MSAFLKMHGLGNDFVVFDARDRALALSTEQIRHVADRRRGIGCDTVVIIRPGGAEADASLLFVNADGVEAESCGNATRCVARLLMEERGLNRVCLATVGGMLLCSDAGRGHVSVDMGPAQLDWQKIPMAKEVDTAKFSLDVDGHILQASAVSMGNPHCVLFVPDADKALVAELGPRIEKLPLFPKRVNVEFAQILSPSHIRMRVWERGIGITQACGTGACAVVVVAARRNLADRKAVVTLDGGDLAIEWRDDGHVLMTGPATLSFRGHVDLNAP